MPTLGISGSRAALLFMQEAARLYSAAVSAHPQRGRKVPHPEVRAAKRVLDKARILRDRTTPKSGMGMFFPRGHQIDQVNLLIERIREDPRALRQLGAGGVDEAFTWHADTAPGLLEIIHI